MIRNRLVVGILDTEALQMDAELTLDKAKQKIHQKDAIKEQQRILSKEGIKQEPHSIDASPARSVRITVEEPVETWNGMDAKAARIDVVGNSTQETNVLLRMLSATIVRRKAIIVPNVAVRKL